MKNRIKRLTASLILMVAIFSACSKKNKPIEQTTIKFTDETHDFANINSKQYVTAVFNFSNTGSSPAIITEVKATCGCTVPEYPKQPLQPNEIGEIKVIYDAKYPGRFNKTVSVYYNGKDSPKELTVRGEVDYPNIKNE